MLPTENHLLVLKDFVGGKAWIGEVQLLALVAEGDVAVQALAHRALLLILRRCQHMVVQLDA